MTRVPQSSDSRRSGFTLIEVVVLMSIVALLMTLGGGILRRLLAADRQMVRALETARQVDRLSSRLRGDVQLATLDERATQQLPSRLILRMADGRRIDYTVTDHRLIREVFEGENRQVRDSFVFPAKTGLEFGVPPASETDSVSGAGGETQAGSRRVRLTLSFSRERAGQPELPRAAPPPRELTIEATLGRLRIPEPADARGAP
jgi:prepilin-type N-terminal cleavage/methylation domain-containing protein